MKKKISSKKELDTMALASGAMVTDSSGKKFNSKKKIAVKRPPVIEPEPPKKLEPAEVKQKPVIAPPPKPVGPDAGSKLVAESVSQASKATVMMISELKRQISEIQFNAAQPILEWVFDFERDSKTKYLTQIKAKAVIVKPTLN